MKPRTVSEYAGLQIKFRLKQFLAQQRRARKSTHDAEAVHDLRVSIRRLQQTLRTFRGLLAPAPAKKMLRRLRKLMALCAAVRDCDVALAVLQQAGVASDEWKAKLAAKRRQAEFALGERLEDRRRWRKRKWLDSLRFKDQKHSEWRSEQSLAVNLTRVLPKLADDFFAAGRLAAKQTDIEYLHEFRLRAKRFRYTLELFQTYYGRDIKDCLRRLRKLQDYLGDINDCAVTMVMLRGDGDAGMAVQRLLDQRLAQFGRHWRLYSSRLQGMWRDWLSHPRAL